MNARSMTQILFVTDVSKGAARALERTISLALTWNRDLDVLEETAWIPASAASLSSFRQSYEDVTPELNARQKPIVRIGVVTTVCHVRDKRLGSVVM